MHNVRQVILVTGDGELLTLGGTDLDTPGYDLLAVAIDSEELLGVVVEATVRLLPIPPETQVLLAAFASVEQAGDGDAVAAVIAEVLRFGGQVMKNVAGFDVSRLMVGAHKAAWARYWRHRCRENKRKCRCCIGWSCLMVRRLG